MRAADAFALTSVSEAASLTLLEAMAERPAGGVTDVGGNPEIVRHEPRGLLFPRGDVGRVRGRRSRLSSGIRPARRRWAKRAACGRGRGIVSTARWSSIIYCTDD